MAAPEKSTPYHLEQDEKVAQVMIYTPTSFFWGEVVVKSVIRVSTWLRTNAVPNRIGLYNAMGLNTLPGCKPFSYSELHIPLSQVQAFHLIPPAQDPPDFDPTEPNRKVQAVNALLNSFLIKASVRIAASSSLKRYLEVNHEPFSALYDAEVSNPAVQSFRGLSVPYMLVRQDSTVFTIR
jgi:hypothetical protein